MAKVPKIDRRLLGEYLQHCVTRDLAYFKKKKLPRIELIKKHLLLSNAMLFIELGG